MVRFTKTKDRAERKEFAQWADLAKETGCRGGKRQKCEEAVSGE
jgi:hypothetical protein